MKYVVVILGSLISISYAFLSSTPMEKSSIGRNFYLYRFSALQAKKSKAKKNSGSKGGFGKSTKSLTKFEADEAATFLEEANGNLDMAQALHFQRSIDSLQQTDQSMYAELQELSRQQQQQSAANKNDPVVPSAAREKLVELTWDSVASFMKSEATGKKPTGASATRSKTPGGGSPVLQEKLRRIARACLQKESSTFSVLDVGCGDGAIVPYLEDIGATRYVGIDLSSCMIQRARRLWGEGVEETSMSRSFLQGSFLASSSDDQVANAVANMGSFDTILFNGSLQFFDDYERVLRCAASLLKSSGQFEEKVGRVVISHANGAAFVQDEHRGSPLIAISTMPSVADLEDLLRRISDVRPMKVVTPEMLASVDGGSAIELDEFYLCACEWQAIR